MTRNLFTVAAILAAVVVTSPGQAQETELTPGIVEQIDIAAKLTNYGMERQDPLLLLAAARVLSALTPDAAAGASAMSTEELLAKAKELASDDAIGALADTISDEATRGLCHGPGTVYGCF